MEIWKTISKCDKTNNLVENLEWVTNEENFIHALDNNRLNPVYVKAHTSSIFSEEEIEYIKKHYTPYSKLYGARVLAKKFNCSHVSIIKIARGEQRRRG